MGDAEIINELKRLSNVVTGLESMIAQQIISNTNLTDMIAQQVTTNTNLTNSIIELQNQVALQTTTNTNLTNMITELQTSVTRLTTITGQLVTVNTRALDETDQANQPLPYDDVTFFLIPTLVANGATLQTLYTDANWGVGTDFYISQIIISVADADHFMALYNQGFRLWIYAFAGMPAPIEEILDEQKTAKHCTPLLLPGPSYNVSVTYSFEQLRRIANAQTLYVHFENYTGQQVQLTYYISGIPR